MRDWNDNCIAGTVVPDIVLDNDRMPYNLKSMKTQASSSLKSPPKNDMIFPNTAVRDADGTAGKTPGEKENRACRV